MTDPLSHRAVTDSVVRSTASDYVTTLTEGLPRECSLIALLLALVSTFVGVCQDHDIDPSAAFEQCADTLNPAAIDDARAAIPVTTH